jgi:hypothetical protein
MRWSGGIVTSVGSAISVGIGLATVAMILAWFACLATGRMPAGLRDVLVWTLAYAVQVAAYAFTVTGAFPDADPRAVPLRPRPDHPIAMTDEGAEHRHRLLVVLRFALLVPHLVWVTLWTAVALLAAVAAWCAALVAGRVPAPLHRFLAAFVRYNAHLGAFMYLAGGPFPGFAGRAGSYPLDIAIAPPARQGRWSVGLRWPLAVPAFLLTSAAGTVLAVGAVGAWWFALITGRMPRGLHRALAYAVRYSAQVYAYALLVTPVYPHSGPGEEAARPYDPLRFPERPRLPEQPA